MVLDRHKIILKPVFAETIASMCDIYQNLSVFGLLSDITVLKSVVASAIEASLT